MSERVKVEVVGMAWELAEARGYKAGLLKAAEMAVEIGEALLGRGELFTAAEFEIHAAAVRALAEKE